MNRAQKNQKVIEDALRDLAEARLARLAVKNRIQSWMPEGDAGPWVDECFKRLWLHWHEHGSTAEFKRIICGVFQARFKGYSEGKLVPGTGFRNSITIEIRGLEPRRWASSSTDDELEELIEGWEGAIEKARNPSASKDFRRPISEWILHHIDMDDIDWHRRDKKYWRELYKRVDEVTVVPPKGIVARTSRNKAKTWECFSSIIIDKTGDCGRQIPNGWHPYDPRKKEPRLPSEWVKKTRYLIRVVKDAPGARRGEDPIEDYGQLTGRMLNGQIRKMLNEVNDPCIDNLRFAAKDKPGDMRRYLVRRRSGC